MKKTVLQIKHEASLKAILKKAEQGESIKNVSLYDVSKSLGYMSKEQIKEMNEESHASLIDLLVLFSDEQLELSDRNKAKQNTDNLLYFIKNMELEKSHVNVAKLIVLKNSLNELDADFVSKEDLVWLNEIVSKKQDNDQKNEAPADLWKKFKNIFHPSMYNLSILVSYAFENDQHNKNLKEFFDREYQKVISATKSDNERYYVDSELMMNSEKEREDYYNILEFVVSKANDDFYLKLLLFVVENYAASLLKDDANYIERYSVITTMLAKAKVRGELDRYVGDSQIVSLFELTLFSVKNFNLDYVYIYQALLDYGHNFSDLCVYVDPELKSHSFKLQLLLKDKTRNELEWFFRKMFDENLFGMMKSLIENETEEFSSWIYRYFIGEISSNNIYMVNKLTSNKDGIDSVSLHDILEGKMGLKECYLLYMMKKAGKAETLKALFKNKTLENLEKVFVFNDVIVDFVSEHFSKYEQEHGEIETLSFFSFDDRKNPSIEKMKNLRKSMLADAKEINYTREALTVELIKFVNSIMNTDHEINLIALMPIFQFLNIDLRSILLNDELNRNSRNLYFAEWLFQQFTGMRIEDDSLLLDPIPFEFDEKMVSVILDTKKLQYYESYEVYKMKFCRDELVHLTLKNYLDTICMVKDSFVRYETIKDEFLAFLRNQVQFDGVRSKKAFLDLEPEYDTPRYHHELDELFKLIKE